MPNVRKNKRLSRFQRAKLAAQLGIELMTVRQTGRGWSELKGPFRTRRTWSVVGKGWVMYGVLAHTDTKKKWFQRWFPTLDAARDDARKRGWWLDEPTEKLKWTKGERGMARIERVKIK